MARVRKTGAPVTGRLMLNFPPKAEMTFDDVSFVLTTKPVPFGAGGTCGAVLVCEACGDDEMVAPAICPHCRCAVACNKCIDEEDCPRCHEGGVFLITGMVSIYENAQRTCGHPGCDAVITLACRKAHDTTVRHIKCGAVGCNWTGASSKSTAHAKACMFRVATHKMCGTAAPWALFAGHDCRRHESAPKRTKARESSASDGAPRSV